jgi:hypothetical protein
MYTGFLNPQGRILYDGIITRMNNPSPTNNIFFNTTPNTEEPNGNTFLVELDESVVEDYAKHLNRFDHSLLFSFTIPVLDFELD